MNKKVLHAETKPLQHCNQFSQSVDCIKFIGGSSLMTSQSIFCKSLKLSKHSTHMSLRVARLGHMKLICNP